MEIQGIYFRHTHSETKRKYPRKQISYSGADPGSSVFLILGITGTFGTKKENKTSNEEKGGGGEGAGGGMTAAPPLVKLWLTA